MCMFSMLKPADERSFIAAETSTAELVCMKTLVWASLLLCAADQLHVHVWLSGILALAQM